MRRGEISAKTQAELYAHQRGERTMSSEAVAELYAHQMGPWCRCGHHFDIDHYPKSKGCKLCDCKGSDLNYNVPLLEGSE
jgi:hypothetical protein